MSPGRKQRQRRTVPREAEIMHEWLAMRVILREHGLLDLLHERIKNDRCPHLMCDPRKVAKAA